MLVRNKYKYNSERKDHKIFVGNVPYECKQSEFYECFKNVEGFKNAELIVDTNTKISRGFGFVTISSQTCADNLKNKIIIFKDRELRFTNYENNTNNSCDSKNNYIYVNNIPDGKNREWLFESFKDHAPIGKYTIIMDQKTGNYKNCGVIEILDIDKYKNLLSKKFIIYENTKLNISKYKYIKILKKHNVSINIIS